MKNKHNKKRNTAFVYEALIKEATAAVLKSDNQQKNKVVNLLKKYFNSKSILSKDLDCYRSLYETHGLDEKDSRRLIEAATEDKRLIDPTGLFNIQSRMISDINKEIDSDIFSNFVPNYKTLATISQIFSSDTSPKDKVLLENQLIQALSNSTVDSPEMMPIDNLVYKSFVKKFNSEYGGKLLEEQKTLLTNYITSFVDNAVELKLYLNEEVARLKTALNEAKEKPEIKNDSMLLDKTDKVINKLENLKETSINESVLRTVLSTQKLVKELSDDAN